MADQIDRLKDHRAAAFQALADLVGLASREFKADTMRREWIDREQAMRLVPALRDSISGLAELARELLAATTPKADIPEDASPAVQKAIHRFNAKLAERPNGVRGTYKGVTAEGSDAG